MADYLGQINNDSNFANGVSIATTANGYMYVAKSEYGVAGLKIYRSTDNGQTWAVCYTFTETASNNGVVSLVAKGNRLYIGWGVYTGVATFRMTIIDTIAVPTSTGTSLTLVTTGRVYWQIGTETARGGAQIDRIFIDSSGVIYAVCRWAGDEFEDLYKMSAFWEGGGFGSNQYSGIYGPSDFAEFGGNVYGVVNYNSSAYVYKIPVGNPGASWTNGPYPYAIPRNFTFLPHPSNGWMYQINMDSAGTGVQLTRTNGTTVQGYNSTSNTWVSSAPTTFTIANSNTSVSAQIHPNGSQIFFFLVDSTNKTVSLKTYAISGETMVDQGTVQLFTFLNSAPVYSLRTNSYPHSSQTKIGIALSQNQTGAYMVKTWTRTFNTAPNAPVITYPAANQWINTRTPLVQWTFSDPDAGDTQSQYNIQLVNAAYTAVLKDTGWLSGNVRSWQMPADWITADGNYYIRMAVRDAAGVWNTANGRGPDPNYESVYIGVDITAPTVSAVNVGAVYSNQASGTTKNVSVDISDGGSGAFVYDAYYSNNNGASWTQCIGLVTGSGETKTIAVPITVEHTYLVDFYVRDNAGNNAANWPVRGAFIIDRTAPAAPTQTNGVLYATSNGVSWSAFSDGPAGLTSGLLLTTLTLQKWNGSAWVTESGYPKSVTGLSYSFTGLTPGTQYRWGVTYTDNAGNVSTLNYTTFTTNTYAVSTINNLSSSGSILNQRPKFRFTPTDANDATLTNFQIQISSSNAFTTNIVDSTYGTTAAGWIGAGNVPSGTAVSYIPQLDLGAGTRYVRVRSYDGKEWGTWSTTITFTIQATTWATTVAADDTAVSKRTIDDIRTKVNAVRQARGLAVIVWTDPVIKDWNDPAATDVKATHIIELRQAIKDIYTALSVTAPTWTTDPIIDSTKERKGQHWIDLRTALIAA
ncbi:hypothetical protein [Bacillus sp. 3255]|uniref:hypothetical protein n=1 Tax=Bacillus sp. 3255 TaxID=2817904 RepID=UPI0028565C92|nr:hypothetical protein [Bacillus sp. 3255]MDR6883012.1 hypothetical protein [Bacillus sp. 3255]